MDDGSIKQIYQQLEKHRETLERQSQKLESIQQTLQKLAVQDEQIKQIQYEQQALWRKFDAVAGYDGILHDVQNFQASCPRKQIHALWYVVVPLGLSQLAVAVKLLGY